MSDWTAKDIDEEVLLSARQNYAALVSAIRKETAKSVALRVGISDTLICNQISDEDKLLRFCAIASAAGMTFAPKTGRVFDDGEADALLKLASIGLKSMARPGADG